MKKTIRFTAKQALTHATHFACLHDKTAIESLVSDHHPLIHSTSFFWNIMMQGKKRAGSAGFNNGFGLIENDKAYINRLLKIAQVIAESVEKNPSIRHIGLCEGPVRPKHVEILWAQLARFPIMARFLEPKSFYTANEAGANWGLLMLSDSSFKVTKLNCEFIAEHPKLINRFQLWKLENVNETKYLALAHFPFSGDEDKVESKALSVSGLKYCGLINDLMNTHKNNHFIFCADFNFNPYLIRQYQDRILDQITHHNSILLKTEAAGSHAKIETVTVDGVLLSIKEKQKYYNTQIQRGLLGKFSSEYQFFKSHLKSVLTDFKELNFDNSVYRLAQ